MSDCLSSARAAFLIAYMSVLSVTWYRKYNTVQSLSAFTAEDLLHNVTAAMKDFSVVCK